VQTIHVFLYSFIRNIYLVDYAHIYMYMHNIIYTRHVGHIIQVGMTRERGLLLKGGNIPNNRVSKRAHKCSFAEEYKIEERKKEGQGTRLFSFGTIIATVKAKKKFILCLCLVSFVDGNRIVEWDDERGPTTTTVYSFHNIHKHDDPS